MEYESQEDVGAEIARLKAQIRDLKAEATIERSQANRVKNCFWLGFAVPMLAGLFAALILILSRGASTGVGDGLTSIALFVLLFIFFAQAVKKGGLAGYWRAVIGFVVGFGVILLLAVLGAME